MILMSEKHKLFWIQGYVYTIVNVLLPKLFSGILFWWYWKNNFFFLTTGHKNRFIGAKHKGSRGWDPDVKSQWCAEHWGPRGRDQTNRGLQKSLQVHENQGMVQSYKLL